MDTIYSVGTNMHGNIERRSIEGQANKKLWRDYKASAVFIVIIAIIVKYIYTNYYDNDRYLLYFFCAVFLIITSIFLREVDNAVNNYVKRKYEFYSLICAELIERYGYTENEMKDIKLKINAFQNNNKLKSAYLISFGIYAPAALFVYLLFEILYLIVSAANFGGSSAPVFLNIAPFLMIIIYVFFFIVPLKKRVSIWYNINNDESKIVDEISNLLMQKNIIDEPISLEVKKQFKNPYWLILIACSFTIIGYTFMDSNLAAQEKQYLKMIYPIEDKLLEILGY